MERVIAFMGKANRGKGQGARKQAVESRAVLGPEYAHFSPHRSAFIRHHSNARPEPMIQIRHNRLEPAMLVSAQIAPAEANRIGYFRQPMNRVIHLSRQECERLREFHRRLVGWRSILRRRSNAIKSA